MRRTLAIVSMLLILAACSGTPETVSDEVLPYGEEGAREEGGSAAGAPEGGDGVTLDVIGFDDRRVIRTASLRVHAEDTRDAYDQIVTLVEGVGGFVASAEVLPVAGEDRQPDISMVLRVPVTELTSTLRSIKDLADEVVSESQQAQDVSEQFVDLEARLVNLEALETELRALLEEVRAQPDADPEKLLRVFNELAAVRGQIEQIQGQIDYLSNQTDLATVQVGLTQTPLAVPVVEEPWAPAEAAKEAARSLVSTLQSLADWVIGFVIYTLPILILVLTAPLLLAFLVYRRMRPDPAPSNPPATVEP